MKKIPPFATFFQGCRELYAVGGLPLFDLG